MTYRFKMPFLYPNRYKEVSTKICSMVPSKNSIIMRISAGEYIIGKKTSEPITESVWSRACSNNPEKPGAEVLSFMPRLRLKKLFGNSPRE